VRASAAPLLAGLWLAPGAALAIALVLLLAGGEAGGVGLAMLPIAASLLPGSAGAAVAVTRGAVSLPAGAAALLAAVAGGLGGALLLGAPPPLALALAALAGALAGLWVGLAVATGREAGRALGVGLLLAPWTAALGGAAPALGGLALGAGIAAVMAGAPAAGKGEPRLRSFAGPAGLGLLAALAVLGAPLGALLVRAEPAVPLLALVVALPGLAVLGGGLGTTPARMGAALLLLQGMAAMLVLAAGRAPAALGLLPAEALLPFRHAVLGAAFLPAFAALVAAALARGAVRDVAAPLGLLALGSLAAGATAGWAEPAGIGYLVAPVLATALAVLLALRGERP
jgi:hypothetical protein